MQLGKGRVARLPTATKMLVGIEGRESVGELVPARWVDVA
jgi:hypothetical protein